MGRHTYSEREATELRATIDALSRARRDGDDVRAKALRRSLRGDPLYFWITDWDRSRRGFDPSDFERLVGEGSIKITRPDDG